MSLGVWRISDDILKFDDNIGYSILKPWWLKTDEDGFVYPEKRIMLDAGTYHCILPDESKIEFIVETPIALSLDSSNKYFKPDNSTINFQAKPANYGAFTLESVTISLFEINGVKHQGILFGGTASGGR